MSVSVKFSSVIHLTVNNYYLRLLSPWLRFNQYFCIALASLPMGEEEAP